MRTPREKTGLAFEVAGLRERLTKIYRLECDVCKTKSATHLKQSVADSRFCPPPNTFSLHCCRTGKIERFYLLCKYCARRTRAGQQFHLGQRLDHVFHIPSTEPKK